MIHITGLIVRDRITGFRIHLSGSRLITSGKTAHIFFSLYISSDNASAHLRNRHIGFYRIPDQPAGISTHISVCHIHRGAALQIIAGSAAALTDKAATEIPAVDLHIVVHHIITEVTAHRIARQAAHIAAGNAARVRNPFQAVIFPILLYMRILIRLPADIAVFDI